jgi:HEAT repeat protein
MMSTSTTARSLFEIRSALADDLVDWYQAVINHFEQTEWKRPGVGHVSLKRICVDAKVYREARRRPEREERGSFREPISPGIDAELAQINEEPLRQNRPELVLWKYEVPFIRHAVILGAPGAGKSFLAASIMVLSAEEELKKVAGRQIDLHLAKLPIFLKLEDLAAVGASRPSDEILVDLLQQYLPVGPALASWMKQKLFSRQCLWILDGLDQIGGEAGVRRVDDWLARIERSQCRAVVTCRTQSFNPQRAPGRSFVQYDLAPFEPSGIQRFIENWYGAGDERTRHLISILQTNPSLEDSCRTPLVATLACLVNEDQNRPLPQNTRRVDLYEKIIRRFQDDEGRSGLDDIEREAELVQMQQLAWNLFSAKPESNQFTGAEMLAAVPEGDARQAGAWVKRLLKCRVLAKGGVVVADGAPQYSFIHRTMLEFLAAKHMSGVVETRGWEGAEVEIAEKSSTVPIKTLIDKKSWLPAWSATIIFLAGCLKRQAASMIEMLWGGRVDIAWHRRMLALQCLAELQAEQRKEKQVDRVAVASFTFFRRQQVLNTTALITGYESCWKALSELNGRVNGERVMDRLRNEVANGRSRSLALEALVHTSAREADLIRELLRCVRESRDSLMRWRAVNVLRSLNETERSSFDYTPALITCLFSDPDHEVSVVATEALKAATSRHDVVARALLDVLRTGSEAFQRRRAVKALGTLREVAARHGDVVPAVLHALREDKDYYVRWSAAEALEEMAEVVADQTNVTLTLFRSLCEDDNRFVRQGSADALAAMGEMVKRHTSEIATILDSALNDGNPFHRQMLVQALGKLASGDAAPARDVIPVLIRSLRGDQNDLVRSYAGSALGKIPEATEHHNEVIPALLHALRVDEAAHVRAGAAYALAAMKITSARNNNVASTLIRSLTEDENNLVRCGAAHALGAMGQEAALNKHVIPALLRALNEDSDVTVQGSVVEALGKLADLSHEDIIPALVRSLGVDRDFDVRLRATYALKTGATPLQPRKK